MKLLEVKSLTKTYDEKSLTTVNNVSFSLKKGEILSIIGPSGTGKSTLAKMIKGIVGPKSGGVFYQGEQLIAKDYKNPDLLNKISYVPQELSLDEDKNIFDNIATKVAHKNVDEIHVAVRDMIEVFGLQYKDFKSPSELSTGQKQRAEMAKALVDHPEVLILDEPFSNLDRSLREELKLELFEILEEREISCIMVTHDLDDAFSGSDRVMVMADGIIQQIGTPEEIYCRPSNAYVARFTGAVNLVAGPLVNEDSETLKVKNSLGEFLVKSTHPDLVNAKFAYTVIRPEMCTLSPKGEYSGKVIKTRFFGHYHDVWVQGVDKNKIIIRTPYNVKLKINQKVRFDIQKSDVYLLPI